MENIESRGLKELKKGEIYELKNISIEELKELNAELLKCLKPEKKDENKMVKLIKVLQSRNITVPLIQESKIGKTISLIIEKEKSFFEDADLV